MDIKSMTTVELLERRKAIAAEAEGLQDVERLNPLQEEMAKINEELESRRATEAERRALLESIAAGAVQKIGSAPSEDVEDQEEIRASKKYLEAWVRSVKKGDDAECRALLSTNVTGGTVPVPTYVEGRIRTAWERLGLMARVTRTYVRGNLQIGFEVSSTAAAVHTEGADAPDEETLVLGSVVLTPVSIKKWIRVSDEAMDMGGEEFADYIVDELTYRIAKAAQARLIGQIVALPAAATASSVSANAVAGTPSLSIVPTLMANLSDEADDPVVVINKLTLANFEAARVAAGFAIDPFRGMDVYYDSTLPAYDAAATGATWIIVGDFGVGAHVNLPNGDEIRVKVDDLSEAESDLVKFVGREYIATAAVADKAFAKGTKPASA